MIRITAMKWAPPFAAGQVRDHRLRWVLREVGWDYAVDLVDAPRLASAGYRALQPFGQVPILQEDGRPVLFESGAIVFDIAMRAGQLLPVDADARSQVLCWLVAALNSVEPCLSNVAEVDFFIQDEAQKIARRPLVVEAARARLAELQHALDERTWLVGDAFTVADLMMSSVLKVGASVGLLDGFPVLCAYQARCFDRPAYREAIAEQCDTIDRHQASDMRYDQVESGG